MRLIVLNPYFSIRWGVRHLLFLLVHGFHSLLPLFLSLFSVLGPGLGSDFILFYGVYLCWVILRRVLSFFFVPTSTFFFIPSTLVPAGGKTGIGSCRRCSFFPSFLASCPPAPFNGLQPTLGNWDEVPKTVWRQDREMVAESRPGPCE